MKNEALYNKTVDILVQAYFNDTLRRGSCYACAVGNLVAYNMGLSFKKDVCVWDNGGPEWDYVFITYGEQKIYPSRYIGEAKKQIDATGYQWQELAKIEYAFETASKGKDKDDHMFNGLIAVIEVLDTIHENTDTAVTTQSKSRFNKTQLSCPTLQH